ncbi:MAG: hypothetical protein ABSH45_20660 [Bryobacteraceae bacterium]|jgi:hypothetical protein
MTRAALALAGAACFLMVGCSDRSPSQPAAQKQTVPPQPVTGQSGLYKMDQLARAWAPDAQVLKLDNVHLTEVPEVPDKAAEWEATFVSPSRAIAKSYTWSAVDIEPSLHKGTFPGAEEPYSGSHGASPFLIAAVKIDTDAALATAKTKAAEYEKKNPGMLISYVLEKTDRFPDPVWRVIWGESLGTSGYSVYIDATTGAYLETMH